jgi:hypothetical protein
MATRSELNERYRKGFGMNAIPFLTEIHEKCKLGYNSIDVKSTSDKHGISPMVVPTMVDLGILTCTGQKKTAKFHWKDGVLVSTELALRIYDKIASNKRAIKENKKLQSQHTVGIKNKKLVPIIGSKRVLNLHDQNTLILRAMTAVHASTRDSLLSKAMVSDIVKAEIGNDTMSERIVKALIDGNYIISKTSFPSPENNLYCWKEQIPNDEHAAFIGEFIKETVGPNRANRIFDFLMFLHKLKTFTSINFRLKIRESKLSSNDQSVITSEVLEYKGNKFNRLYKWKDGIPAPSIELAESMAEKSRAYGSKYAKPSSKVSKPSNTPMIKVEQTHKNYSGKTKLIVNYLKDHGTITTEQASKLLPGMSMHAISNIFWRICKDKVVERTAHKTYSIVNTGIQPNVVEAAKVEQKTKIDSNSTDFISKLKAAIHSLKTRKQEKEKEYKAEMLELDTKIQDAEKFLSVKENENAFLDSISVLVTDSYKVSHKVQEAVSGSQKKNTRHAHNRAELLEFLKNKGSEASLKEMSEHFYPSRNLGWNDAEYSSLSAMVYQLKREEKIEASGSGYKIKVQQD